MHAESQMGFEPAVIPGFLVRSDPQATQDHEELHHLPANLPVPENYRTQDHEERNIELHLQSVSDEGSAAAAEIIIDRFPFVIGRRHDCDYKLNKLTVSRYHCSIVLYRGKVWVKDLESTNGTYLNGKEITAPEILREGDLITLDPFSFRTSFVQRQLGRQLVNGSTLPNSARPRCE